MKEIEKFISRFARAHWDLQRENYFGKKTDSQFKKDVAKVSEEFVAHSKGVDIERASAQRRKEMQASKDDYSDRSEPVPLVIIQYENKKSTFWRCFMTVERDPQKYLGFGSIYDVEKVGKDLKIVAESRRCPECRGVGKLNGKKCVECKGSGLVTFTGKVPVDPGDVVEILEVNKTDSPKDRDYYKLLVSLK